MSLYATSWVLYIVGIALIAGGYLGFVSPGISWVGWIMGTAGWGMQYLPGYRKNRVQAEPRPEEPDPKPES